MKEQYFISTGEVSGDRHAAMLVKALQKHKKNIKITAIGGDYLKKTGINILSYSTDAGSIGFVEVFRFLFKNIKLYRKVHRFLIREKPNCVILIDAQGFNMRVAKLAKKLGLTVVYYIAPQEWHWGTEKGGKDVIRNTDLILSIFKEEHKFYRNLGGNSLYIGHPIVDLVKVKKDSNALKEELGLSKKDDIISIFPGSRYQEIKGLYPLFYEVGKKIKATKDNIKIVVAIASKECEEQIKKYKTEDFLYYTGNSHDLMSASLLALACSGTATLEQAILGLPTIVAGKIHPISYQIALILLRRTLKTKKIYISLPNIIKNKEIVPEFIQKEVTEKNIFEKAMYYLNNPAELKKQRKKLKEINKELGEPGSVVRAAQAIIEIMTQEGK